MRPAELPPHEDGVMAASTQDHPYRRALALLVGAGLVLYLFDSGRASLPDVPVLLGIVYFAAAVAGGTQGALWAPACVVSGWGLANLALGDPLFADLRMPESAAHMCGIGLGVMALAGLHHLGVRTSIMGVGLSVLLSGVLFVAQRGQGVDLLNDGRGYALLLAVFAAAELVTVQVSRRR